MPSIRTGNPFLKLALEGHEVMSDILEGINDKDLGLAIEITRTQALIALAIQLESLETMLIQQFQYQNDGPH